MIFKIKAKNLSVYDPLIDKFIAEFKDNTFETEDERLIARLKELEYYPEEPIILATVLVPEVKPEDVSITPLVKEEPLKEKKQRGRPKKEKQ